jgi:hypothetical protein
MLTYGPTFILLFTDVVHLHSAVRPARSTVMNLTSVGYIVEAEQATHYTRVFVFSVSSLTEIFKILATNVVSSTMVTPLSTTTI